MHSANVLTVLALAATTLAAPHRNVAKRDIVYETVVHVVYETVIAGQAVATPSATSVVAAAAALSTHTRHHHSHSVYTALPSSSVIAAEEPSSAVVVPVPSSTVVVVSVPSSAVVVPVPSSTVVVPVASSAVVVPVPSSTVIVPVPSSAVVAAIPSATAASTSTGYMAIVSEYRTKLGLSALTQSSAREATALKTAQDGNGEMVHELLPGTYAQVLAPGTADDFLHVFVGGWLCEKPDMAGLDGICTTESVGWTYSSTGHADILTSAAYSTIGCALADGIWACDLA